MLKLLGIMLVYLFILAVLALCVAVVTPIVFKVSEKVDDWLNREEEK